MNTRWRSRIRRTSLLNTATIAVSCVWVSRTVYASNTHTFSVSAVLAQPKAVEAIRVSNAYALPALKGGTGGAFMQISNTGAVAVRILRTTSVDANAVELHESMEHNGSTHMQQLKTLDIAPGASTSLKAGEKHFMLIGLRRALANGDTVRLMLTVENAGAKTGSNARDIAVVVPVRIP